MSVLGTLDSLGRCKAIVTGLVPIATDNCPMLGVNYTLSGATIGNGIADASGTLFMTGITTVHYIAIDMAGNTDTCSFTVNIKMINLTVLRHLR
ncbi:MAG: HYR domain-containing protein [Saprospiraceae bacterium]|nr:HYR domain-containing protein [Saprospiraceae bacterium]